jgi:rare lipoprotein A
LACLTCLTGLIAGCGEPVTEPKEAASPTEITAVLLPETPVGVESVVATDTPETANVAEPALVATEEPVAEEPRQEIGTESEAPATTEAATPNWEEGRITFKSPSLQGELTASGEPFDKDAMTAAHKELPFGTVVTVTNLFNGKQTTVIVNDRLPSHVSAILDLSPAAAATIDMIDAGIVDGRIEW